MQLNISYFCSNGMHVASPLNESIQIGLIILNFAYEEYSPRFGALEDNKAVLLWEIHLVGNIIIEQVKAVFPYRNLK